MTDQSEELEALKQRINVLENALRPSGFSLYRGITLTLEMLIALEVLYQAKGTLTTHSFIVRLGLAGVPKGNELMTETALEQLMHRLRHRLLPNGISISRARGSGFYIDKPNKQRLKDLRFDPGDE